MVPTASSALHPGQSTICFPSCLRLAPFQYFAAHAYESFAHGGFLCIAWRPSFCPTTCTSSWAKHVQPPASTPALLFAPCVFLRKREDQIIAPLEHGASGYRYLKVARTTQCTMRIYHAHVSCVPNSSLARRLRRNKCLHFLAILIFSASRRIAVIVPLPVTVLPFASAAQAVCACLAVTDSAFSFAWCSSSVCLTLFLKF